MPLIDARSLARLITGIESREPSALKKLSSLPVGEKSVIGITGPPGAGKSSLADSIIKILRKKGKRVGVVAIDPSSPFSGGALLGDRIRMQGHAGDKGVFIRSVGSRGSHGGLSRATRDIVRAFAAYGMDYIIVETVGVGQTELDIMEIADVTIVVLVPESGDMIQTMKAGLLEIADIFVVNKADRDGAEQMKSWLVGMFDTGVGLDAEAVKHHGKNVLASRRFGVSAPGNSAAQGRQHAGTPAREVPVLLTQANREIGIDELMKAIEMRIKAIHGDVMYQTRKKDIRRQEFFDMCAEEFKSKLADIAGRDKEMKKLVSDISNGTKSPYEGLNVVLKRLFRNGCSNRNF